MNHVTLMGRLARDAEVRYSRGDQPIAVARFTLAIDRRVRRDSNTQNTADFIPCTAFGRTAEFLERFGRKGTKFAVEGRLQSGSYTNREGKKVFTLDLVVENIEFAESRNPAGNQGENRGYTPAQQGAYQQPAQQSVPQYSAQPVQSAQAMPSVPQSPAYSGSQQPVGQPVQQSAGAEEHEVKIELNMNNLAQDSPAGDNAGNPPEKAGEAKIGDDGFLIIEDGIDDSLPF